MHMMGVLDYVTLSVTHTPLSFSLSHFLFFSITLDPLSKLLSKQVTN
jgi:hypothetical protein